MTMPRLRYPPNQRQARHLLADAIERVRPMLHDPKKSTKQRLRLLWSAAKHARHFAAADVIQDAFTKLAIETGLIDAGGWYLGVDVRPSVRRFGKQDVAHVLSFAARWLNPFERGASK